MSPEIKIPSASPPPLAVPPPREEATPLTPSAVSGPTIDSQPACDQPACDQPSPDSSPMVNSFSHRRPSQARLRGLDPRLILV